MPELPEVESARRLAERHCVGLRVARVHAEPDDKVLDGCSPAQLRESLEGHTVSAAGRRGKHLWLETDGGAGPALLMHLGMTGRLQVQGVAPARYVNDKGGGEGGDWPPPHTKLWLELAAPAGSASARSCRLAFSDPRRFGRLRLVADGRARDADAVATLGPDALDELPPPAEFAAALRRRPAAKLKALLLDQRALVSGAGNWVADEALFQSALHPEQRAGDLCDARAAALRAALADVVRTAVEAGADSDRFPSTWLFHHRWTGNRPGRLPSGERIEVLTVGGRTSAFVPSRQRLVAAGGAAGAAGGAAGAAGGAAGAAGAAETAEAAGAAEAGAGSKRRRNAKAAKGAGAGEVDGGAAGPAKRQKRGSSRARGR